MISLSKVLLFVFAIPTRGLVKSQTFQNNGNIFVGHTENLPDLESTRAATLWIAPDDVIVTQTSDQRPMPCPGSNLRSVVSRALRLSSRRVVLRPLCQEGLVLYKTKISVLVDAEGPTYCALIVSSADQLHVRDIIFDHGDCINATITNTGLHSVLTAESTAAVVLRPRLSRLDSQTSFQNLTFQSRSAAVALLLSPPTWEQTLQLDGPSFTALRSHTQEMRFVALLITGRLKLVGFEAISVTLLRDPIAGLDRSITTVTEHHPVTDLWKDMDARVLMRLRQTREALPSPSTCPLEASSSSHTSTLTAIGFSLTAVLAVCVFILLVHSCRSTEAQDMAPYRLVDAVVQDHTTPTP